MIDASRAIAQTSSEMTLIKENSLLYLEVN